MIILSKIINCFFRKKSIQELYCFCLYGLNDNSYTRESFDRFGNVHYTACIDKSYFSSFSNIKSKEEYLLKKDSNDKPVVIFIHNPHLFFQKIRNFFVNLGIREEDIIISPVEYLDYEKNAYSSIPYPHELLLKDKFYSNQSEIRIIINSTNSDYIKYMNEHNNIIDVGDISDIVDIYDYYFDDMLLEKRGNTLLFTLPFPIQERIEDMTLRRMLNIFIQIYKDDLPYETTVEERKKELDLIKDTIYKKYKITLVVRDDKIYFPDLYDDLEKILDK